MAQKQETKSAGPLKTLPSLLPRLHPSPQFCIPGHEEIIHPDPAKKNYDFILISYVLWADLIVSDAVGKSVTLLDLSDFMTLNRFDSSGGNITVGPMMAEEIRRVNLFQKVLCISREEKWFFSQFASHPRYYDVPFFMEGNPAHYPMQESYPYTMVFVGSDNPHNIKGLHWFIKEVFPLLPNTLNLKIVGSIARHVAPHPRIHGVELVEDTADIYRDAKMAICPLLGGTGMKSKVVEALSYGLPVVATSKGVVGLPVKTGNGCPIADTPASFAHHIKKLDQDPPFYRQQKQEACRFFLDYCQPAAVYPQLDQVFLTRT